MKKSKYKVIELNRKYKEDCTLGKMVFPDDDELCTIELPWRDNQQNISCVPEGEYVMEKRVSGVVNRTSKGKYVKGWEITDIDGRTYIMVHIGNTVDDIEGCVAVGKKYGLIDSDDAVYYSAEAFDIFMAKMEKYKYWKIKITKAEK